MYDHPLFLLFIVSSLLNIGIAVYGWRHRRLAGAAAFSLAMLLFAILPLTQAVNEISSDLAIKVIALKSRVDMAGIGATLWLIMMLQLSGYSHLVNRRSLIALFIMPVAILILNWTENPLFRSGYYLDSVGSSIVLRWNSGPLFWFGLAYINILLLTPLYLLWHAYRRISPLSLQQTLALSISATLPIVFNLLIQLGVVSIPGVNFPFAAGPLMGVIVAWAIFQYHVFDVVPIARGLLIESMRDGVMVLDTQNRIVDINPAMQQLIGSTMIGQSAESAFAAWPNLVTRFRDVTEARTEISVDENPPLYFDLRISPLFEGSNQLTGRLIVIRDITKFKQTELALQTSENNLRRMVESAPDAMLIVDQTGTITFANEQSEKIFGYAQKEIPGQRVEILIPKRFHEIHKNHRADYHQDPQTRSMGMGINGELSARRKDGSEFPVEISLSPLETETGLSVTAAVRDITGRKQAEEALREAESRYRTLVEQMPAVVYIDAPDEAGTSSYISPQVKSLLGYPLAEWEHDSYFWFKCLHPEDHERAVAIIHNTLTQGRATEEYRMLGQDGREVWVRDHSLLVRDAAGEPQFIQGFLEDVTERKRAEELLHRQNNYLKALHQITLDLFNRRNVDEVLQSIVDRATEFLDAPFCEIMFMEDEELVIRAFTSNQPFLARDRFKRGQAKLSWQAFDTKSVVIVNDYSHWEFRREVYEGLNLSAVLALPILAGDECVGVLDLSRSQTGYFFDDSDIQAATLFAQLAALVIDNARLNLAAENELAERKRAEEELHHKSEYLETLHQITLDLLNRRDVDDLLNAIINNATRLLDASYGDLDIVEGDVMVTRAYTENQSFEKNLQTPRGEAGTASWQAYDTRQPVIINDYSNWPQRNPVFEDIPIHATIIVPLISGDHCLGVFSLSRSEADRPFTPDEIQLTTLFAQQAALALDNAQLHVNAQHEIEERKRTEETLRSQNDYLAALHEITLGLINRLDPDSLLEAMLAHFVALMKTRHAFIELLDLAENVLIQKVAVGNYAPQNGFRTALGMGLTGRVWASGEMLIIPNYPAWEGALSEFQWLRSVAGIPLKIGGKVIGVIGVAFDEPDRIFTSEEIDLLQRFANLAAVALDNAQLFTGVMRQSKELRLLHEVRTAIAGELDMNRIIKRTVEAIAETFGYTLVSLYLREGDTLILQHQVGYDQVIREIPITKGISGQVVRTGEPVLVENVRNDPAFLGAIEGIVSEAIVPIFDEGRVTGTLSIESRYGVKLTEADLRLMVALSDQISVAIGRARLYNSLQRNNERLSILHEISLDLLNQHELNDLLQTITDQIVRLHDSVMGYIALNEDDELVDKAITPRDLLYQLTNIGGRKDISPVWQVFESREPFITDDFSSLPNIRPETAALGVKAAIFLPILYGETCRGVLGTGRTQPNYPFDKEDINFGGLFAKLAAVALDNAQMHHTLREESIRDPLTGLFNRRFMQEALTQEVLKAKRTSRPLAIVMLDLDHFKRLNDTFGHDAGDEALRRLGLLLKTTIRGSDIACRYGGEEFTLILSEASLTGAMQRMEQLRQDIKALTIRHLGKSIDHLSGSFGIAIYPNHGTTSETLLKSADEALYRAKQAGRDRVIAASI